MTPLAIVFMAFSWSFVLGLTAWCFRRILRANGVGRRPPPDDGDSHGR